MNAAYLAIVRIHCLELMQYRAAAVAGILTQFAFGVVRWQVLLVFFHADPAASPLDEAELVAYVWLGQAFLGFILFRQDHDLGEAIRSGTVANDLLRPIDAHGAWLMRALARRLAPTLLRCGPLLLISLLAGWVTLPATPVHAVAALSSLLLASILAAALAVVLAETAFWSVSSTGLGSLVPPLIWFFSGITVPLPLLPDWLQRLGSWTPFAGMLDRPLQVWIGSAPAGPLLLQQLLWIAILVLVGRLIARHGLRRLTIAGG